MSAHYVSSVLDTGPPTQATGPHTQGWTTHSGYGTTPVGCRDESRYVEGCRGPLKIHQLKIRCFTKKGGKARSIWRHQHLKQIHNKHQWLFNNMFGSVGRCLYVHTLGFSFFLFFRFSEFQETPTIHKFKLDFTTET